LCQRRVANTIDAETMAEKKKARKKKKPVPELPAWLTSLIASTRDTFDWHTPEWGAEGDGRGEDHIDVHLPMSAEIRSESNAMLARSLFVGNGPTLTRSEPAPRELPPSTATLWLDTDAPDQLHVGVLWGQPPFLWVPAGRDRASIEHALSPYTGDGAETSKTCHLLLGLRKGGLPDDLGDLGRHFVLQPFVDYNSIGHNPNILEMCTYFSRSFLRMDGFQQGAVVKIHYSPAPHGEVVARYNERFDKDFPLDVPIDVVGALLGFSCESARRWADPDPVHRDDPNEIRRCLVMLYYLEHPGLPATLDTLRSHRSPEVRETVAKITEALKPA
jgi:hypothetical protein